MITYELIEAHPDDARAEQKIDKLDQFMDDLEIAMRKHQIFLVNNFELVFTDGQIFVMNGEK